MSTKFYKATSFSIIYKAEVFIQGLIDNILEQEDFENIEFIFINPASPDESKNILLPYLKKHANFKLIDLDSDPGLYECWNIAVKESSSDIITNWNPDDRRTKDSIKILTNTLILLKDYDLVYGITLVTTNKNEKVENCKSELMYSAETFCIKNLFFNNSPHCMPAWRKNIHDKFGYFENSYKSAADADMWLRAAFGGSKFFFLKRIVGSYYESDYTVSRNKENFLSLVNEVYEMRCKNLKRFMGLT